ncbi:uncharacterized protein [Panulirus ornatus]
MDGFFLSIFLAVCVLVAVLMRCICYRSSCIRRLLSNSDDDILPRHTAPIITPSRSQQQQQHSPQLSDDVTDSPIIPHNRAVFTIYTFQQQPSPLLQRSPHLADPPKYSSLPADAPPKYEDLFPMVEMCNSCKGHMSLPTVPLQDLQQPLQTPVSSTSTASTTCSAHSPCSSLTTSSTHTSSTTSPANNSSSATSPANNSSSTTSPIHTSSNPTTVTDLVVSPADTSSSVITTSSSPITSPVHTPASVHTSDPSHSTSSTSSTHPLATVHTPTYHSVPSEDPPLDTVASQPMNGE